MFPQQLWSAVRNWVALFRELIKASWRFFHHELKSVYITERWPYLLSSWLVIQINMVSRIYEGFPGGSDGKASACNVGDLGLIPGLERSYGEGHGHPLQYSCLENPMDRGVGQAAVHGVAKSRARLSDWHVPESLLQVIVLSFYPFSFLSLKKPCALWKFIGKDNPAVLFSFPVWKLCASSFQPECLFSSFRTWYLPLDSWFLPLYVNRGMELMSANCLFQLCSQARKFKAVGTIYHCVIQLGRKHVLPHSFRVIASWVKTSNDSDSEAVCSNDGNYSSLQVQKLTQCFSSLLLYDFRKNTWSWLSLFHSPWNYQSHPVYF